ncbi:MAG: hypothetical protein AAGH19_06465 [Pseudomonadota bacterium]
MKPHVASLINALVLFGASAWAWFGSDMASTTALIPTFFGIVLIACLPGVKAENKIVAHLAAVVTLLLLVALIMPLRGAIGREDTTAILRVSLMMASTAFALVFFIKSFIDVRKRRAAA